MDDYVNKAAQATQAVNAVRPASHLQVLNNDLHDLIDRLRHAENRLVGIVERAFGAPPTDAALGQGLGGANNAPQPNGGVPNTQQQVQTAHGLSNRIHALLEKVESII